MAIPNGKSLGFDFGDWDEKKAWEFDLPSETMDLNRFLWLFDVPFYHADDGRKHVISAWDILHKKPGSTNEQRRLKEADESIPIIVLYHNNKWFVLDGIHRLIKAYQKGEQKIATRVFPEERLPEIE